MGEHFRSSQVPLFWDTTQIVMSKSMSTSLGFICDAKNIRSQRAFSKMHVSTCLSASFSMIYDRRNLTVIDNAVPR